VRILAALALLLASCASHSGLGPRARPDPPSSRFRLYVLGIAQDGGMPHLGCQKPCCESARREGRRLHPACLAIQDTRSAATCLVEATPDIEAQISLLQRLSGHTPESRHPVDCILLTHAHIGHYLGLAQLGYEVANTQQIPVWVSHRMADFLSSAGPWSQLVAMREIVLETIEPRTEFEPLPGLRVTAIPVVHRDEFSDTLAFKIRGEHKTVLFVPDTDRFSDAALSELLDGVDVAYIDATFYDGRELPGRDITKIPHPPIVETMARLAEEARERPGRIRFIHLNHTNPALRDEAIRKDILARGFRVAEQGEWLDL